MKLENVSLKTNREDIPSNGYNSYNSKESNDTKGLFGKRKDKTSKDHGKNAVKDKLSSHCYNSTEEPYFHLCDDLNNVNVSQ